MLQGFNTSLDYLILFHRWAGPPSASKENVKRDALLSRGRGRSRFPTVILQGEILPLDMAAQRHNDAGGNGIEVLELRCCPHTFLS